MKHPITSLFMAALTSVGHAEPARPNVILIISDELGCQGAKGVKTSHSVELLPFITEITTGRLRETLFWPFNIDKNKPEESRWAIRHGDWMLLQDRISLQPMELRDLANDPFHKANVIHEHPKRAAAMRKQWETWNSEHPALPLQQKS